MPANSTIKRAPIPIAIKDHIRSHYRQNQNLSIKDMVTWAEEKYKLPFLPATMRTILFPKPNKAGTLNSLPIAQNEGLRERVCNWPELENELASWYKSLPFPPKGEELKEMAKELWKTLAPQHYNGQQSPAFGDSWRDKFKRRHGFKLKQQNSGCLSQNQVSAIRVAGDYAKPRQEVEAADATISSNMNHEVRRTRGIHQLFSPFVNSRHQEMTLDPELLKDSQSSTWNELGGIFTGERFPGIPLAFRDLSIKLNENVVPEGISRMRRGSWQRTVLSPLGSESAKFKPDIPKNDTGHFKSTLSISDPKSSTNAELKHYCTTQTSGNTSKKQTLNDHKPIMSNNVGPINSDVLHNSERDSVIRESVFNLLHLSPECEQRQSTISAERIIEALIFDLEAADLKYTHSNGRLRLCQYHKSAYNRLGADISQSMKALQLLHSGINNIKVKASRRKEWSEWEMDFINNFLISSSPPSSPPQGYHDDRHSTTTTFDMNKFRKDMLRQRYWDTERNFLKNHRASIFTMISCLGRIDILTSTFPGLNTSGIDDFMAEVILTLQSSAQLRFVLPPTAALGHNFSITPTISIRKTIARESAVFRIASFGTVGELIEMFSSGEASPDDCDPDGRSLYALAELNVETSFYLLDFVTEIDRHEIDRIGILCPLIHNIPDFVSEMESKVERKTRCFKKMLERGSDLSLEFTDGDGMGWTIFQTELEIGSKEDVEAILNSEQVLINANTFGIENLSRFSSIIFLADFFTHGSSERFDMLDKFNILIRRGADINSRDKNGKNCFHLVLAHDNLHAEEYGKYNHFEFKSILMAIITAGGDLKALDDWGRTPSNIACLYGNEEIWIESLAACGHNPWDIISLDDDCLKEHPGLNVFLATNIEPRSEKLSFKEFLSDEKFSVANRRRHAYWEGKFSAEERVRDTLIRPENFRMGYMQKLAFVGQIGIDAEDEYWFGAPHICGHGFSTKKAIEGISTSIADHYRPINADPAWLAYVHRPQYIFYLVGHDPNCEYFRRDGSTDDEAEYSEYEAHDEGEMDDESDQDNYFEEGPIDYGDYREDETEDGEEEEGKEEEEEDKKGEDNSDLGRKRRRLAEV